MSSSWFEAYLGLIFQVYGLAFFVLGVAALLSMRRDTSTGLAAHLGWLAAFGMLHGLQEFIDGERLHNPAAWLVVLSTALMVASFAALLEFGRRLWNERPGGRRLAALPLYTAAGLGTVALMLAASAIAAGLELGARYLLGAPGAALAGIGLLAQARATTRAPDTVIIIRWLHIAALAILGYAALTLFLSPGSGRLLADWLPTTADFLAATGLPVQLARALCAVLLAVGFVILNLRSGSLAAVSLRRVTDRLNGFVYRCRNDQNWSVTFMSEGGETLTGYPSQDFLRGERHFSDQIHPDDQQRVWAEVQAALAARRDFHLQYRMIDRAGTVRWCYEEGRGIFDTRDELLFLEGLVRNDDARHQALQALQQERDFAKSLLDTAPAIILLLDPQGMVRHVNPWFEQLTGYRRDEVVGKEWFATFLPTRDQARIRALFASALHDQPVRGNINPIVTREGEELAIEWHAMPLRDADGQMTGVLSIGMDVTKRQQLERELLRSEALLNSVIQQIPAMVFLKRASDLRFELLNRAGEELLGFEQTTLLGKSDHDFFPPEQATAFVAKDRQVLDSGQPLEIPEEAILARNGETYILHTRKVGIYDAAGEPTHLLGISLDITEQKRMQEMMAFLASASSASDPDAFFRLCVRKLAEFYGARYAFIGLLQECRQEIQTIAVWTGEDFAPNFEYNLDGTPCRDVLDLRQELIPHEAARLYPNDAMLIDMGVDSYYGAPLTSSSGQLMGILSVMDTQAMAPTPWTAPLLGVFASRVAMELERKAAIDSLRELNTSLEQRVAGRTAEAERANAAKSEFLSRMSHELRTPLNAILGFTQILQLPDEQALSTQQADSVREIHHAGEHLLGLVNEVLDLARIESGRLELNLEPLALVPVIERSATLIAPAAVQRGISITLPSQHPCTVLADPSRLSQVLLNLLSNAVKYNRKGGSIAIDCLPVAGQRMRVSVRDTGRGLNADQMARLFRPFERLESAYEGIEGTGIGLALAKQLVEGMQGSIGVDSVPGEGSCFWFELPLYEQVLTVEADPIASTLASTGTVSPASQENTHTILYIEDNPANLRLVKKILEKRADIKFLSADNAEDGLLLAARTHPDLILMDINLPGMNGFEALKKLRADPDMRAIPVIAVSANAMKGDTKRANEAGFADYITKPIQVHAFLNSVEHWLSKTNHETPNHAE